ncbi:HAD family hydrolase [Geobacter pickeringii]|uniref:HAD family hydrolase n=1 Tax=Geobacter pickeringii TaxID=345632 RepID=UPI00068A54CB|nr:HAD family hydrolase [Geobacter pickeringii]
MIDLSQDGGDGALGGVKAVVFDLDGTLYVSRELGEEIAAVAARYLAERRGITPEEADRLIRETKAELTARTGFRSSLSHATIELGGDLRELHCRFAAEIDPSPFLVRDERVIRFLRDLARRAELILYTNNNRSLAERILAGLGLARAFRRVVTIEESWRPKPDRQTLEEIIGAAGVCPEECLFVGDRYDIDLRLPAELGCQVYLSRSVDELLALHSIMSEEHR